jgi:phosphatidylserine/phosphatidylglycerophosphate/cardiolipin synthase-like enzyme
MGRGGGYRLVLLQPGSTCWRTATAARAKPILDTQDYFLAAKAAMARATRSIHLLGWAFDPLTQLTPDAEGNGPVEDQAGPFLRDLAKARPGLDVRVLIWKSALPVAASQHFFPHRARACFKNTPVRFRLDASVPFGACHHQKVLVIDDALAFCGGGDISIDRWDSTGHLDDDHRRHMPTGGVHDPRHEVMLMVEGEAAAMLGDLFRRRWARATREALPAPAQPPAQDLWPQGVEPDFRGVTVGLARTEPAWRDQPEVCENEALHLAAIKAARRAIYLENQYVASPAIGEALAARLAEPDGPEVLVVSTEHSPSWFDRMTMDKTRSALIRRLQEADRHGRFHAYCPETAAGKTIIVHAKHTIIDDVLLRVGSTNLNNRSTGFDSECDLAIELGHGPEHAEARAAITRHRTRTLAHFLGASDAAFDAAFARTGSLAGAIEALDTGPQRRLRKLGPVHIGPLAAVIATFHLGDPVTPGDSWRPWRRRRDLQEGLRLLAPDLAETSLLADRRVAPSKPGEGEHTRAPRPRLKGEDFIQSD